MTYRVPNKATAQLLYFGGIERSASAPEGAYWRHHFDAVGEYDATTWLQLAAQADYGFEPNRYRHRELVCGRARGSRQGVRLALPRGARRSLLREARHR